MIVDLLIIVLLVFFALRGKQKGFIRSIYSLLSLALSMILVYVLRDLFTQMVAKSGIGLSITEYIASVVGEEFAQVCSASVISVLSLIALYFLVGFLLKTFTGLLDFIAKLPILNSINQLLGFGLGIVVGVLWIFVFVNVGNLIPDVHELLKDSYIIDSLDFFII